MYIIVDFTIKARIHTRPTEVLELEDMRRRMDPSARPALYLQGSVNGIMV